MTLEICRRPWKVQGYISEPIDSTLSKLPLSFKSLDKLTNTQTLLLESFNLPASTLKPLNILSTVFAGFKALSKIYFNEKLQDIIQIVIKTRFATTIKPCECFFKACFLMFIRVISIWFIISFFSNAKIFLSMLKQRDIIAHLLQFFFFKIVSVFVKNNISISWIMKVGFYPSRINSNYFYSKVLAIQEPLYIVFDVKSNKIYNINRKTF